jgi:GMP synthase-like glutamine amidotransferase
MKVHVLQHVPFEGLGSIAGWVDARGARVTWTRFFREARLPALGEVDLLIALGGPMSVNDEAVRPWLRAEKQFVREALTRGIAVLGVCLGAQLIASALGARVVPNPVKEIGWFPIEAVEAIQVARGSAPMPRTCTVFHWHGETFELPPGAIRLARSAGCENQAFQLGRNVVGVQFHLESTPETVRALVHHCAADLVPGPYVQSGQQLLATPEIAYAAGNACIEALLAYLTDGLFESHPVRE